MKIVQARKLLGKPWEYQSERIALKNPLVLVFADRFFLGNDEIINEVKEEFPYGQIVFTSVSGEISGTQVNDKAIVVSAIEFEKSSFLVEQTNLVNLREDPLEFHSNSSDRSHEDNLMHTTTGGRTMEEQLKQKSLQLLKVKEELLQTKEKLEKLTQEKKSTAENANEVELNRLKESHEKLNILLNNSPVGMFLAKNRGNGVIMSNDAVSTMLGFSRKELEDLNVTTVLHTDDQPRVLKELETIYNGEKAKFSLKTRLITKDKKILWVKCSVMAIPSASGKVKYGVGIFEDITEEKKLRDRIEQSNLPLYGFLENLPVGVLMENMTGKITLVNKKFREIFDIKTLPEQLIGTDSGALFEHCKLKTKNPEQFIQRTNEIISEKLNCMGETIFFTHGQVFARNSLPLMSGNIEKGRIWAYQNITKEVNFERKIQEQKEKYTTLIANMNLGCTETNVEGFITMVNKSFCEFTGYSEEELIGKKGAELLLVGPSRDGIPAYRNIKKLIHKSRVLTIKTKSGKIKYLLVGGIRTFNSSGEAEGNISIQFDITEQKKLERQKEILLKELEVQNEQLNDYAHVVSHDLKSPLQSISALISWTKEDFSNNLWDAGLKNLTLIEERVEKMDRLISNILKYSSLNNAALNKGNIDLNLVVQEILDMMLISNKIEVKIVKKLPVIVADTARMQQLFQNLLSNALNHVDEEKGRIEIDFMDTETHYQFAIRDNGKGIMKKYHDKIFKVFKSFDDREMSTGIGLSIVQKIVDQYDGEVWFESEIGLGTTFYLTLKKQL